MVTSLPNADLIRETKRSSDARLPTMLIHGALSDLVSTETATVMTQRGPRALLKIVEGVGHAPMFMTEDQIALVRDFLYAA